MTTYLKEIMSRVAGAAEAPPMTPTEGLHDVSIAMVSDTHGRHRDVYVPDADILIHAGDFTHFGKIKDAVDFK